MVGFSRAGGPLEHNATHLCPHFVNLSLRFGLIWIQLLIAIRIQLREVNFMLEGKWRKVLTNQRGKNLFCAFWFAHPIEKRFLNLEGDVGARYHKLLGSHPGEGHPDVSNKWCVDLDVATPVAGELLL